MEYINEASINEENKNINEEKTNTIIINNKEVFFESLETFSIDSYYVSDLYCDRYVGFNTDIKNQENNYIICIDTNEITKEDFEKIEGVKILVKQKTSNNNETIIGFFENKLNKINGTITKAQIKKNQMELLSIFKDDEDEPENYFIEESYLKKDY